MAKTKEQKRREALDRLVARLPQNLSEITFSQRMEYNSLKRKLKMEGRI